MNVRKGEVVVMDGGFATQLSCHVDAVIDGDVLWSARFLSTAPQAVIEAHLDFLRSGAELIITNTYQANVDLFMKHLGFTYDESYNLIKKAVELAKKARDTYMEEIAGNFEQEPPLVVGSVGPYGASLHDGSEYTGTYADTVSKETMREWHKPRIQALVEAGVDLLALETIPCLEEAEMLVELLKEYPNTKAWLSFSCRADEQHTSYGDDFQYAATKCYDLNPDQLVAVGVNCLSPKNVRGFLIGINDGREDNPIPLIAYPNSGEKYSVEFGWIEKNRAEPVEDFVKSWLDIGVKWVGGCCRTYASDVSRIRNEVKRWLYIKKILDRGGDPVAEEAEAIRKHDENEYKLGLKLRQSLKNQELLIGSSSQESDLDQIE